MGLVCRWCGLVVVAGLSFRWVFPSDGVVFWVGLSCGGFVMGKVCLGWVCLGWVCRVVGLSGVGLSGVGLSSYHYFILLGNHEIPGF